MRGRTVTTAHHHPIRHAHIRIFRSVEDGEHMGRFKPYDAWPILFFGDSEDQVRAKMPLALDVLDAR